VGAWVRVCGACGCVWVVHVGAWVCVCVRVCEQRSKAAVYTNHRVDTNQMGKRRPGEPWLCGTRGNIMASGADCHLLMLDGTVTELAVYVQILPQSLLGRELFGISLRLPSTFCQGCLLRRCASASGGAARQGSR
jgi:hypothetical protein